MKVFFSYASEDKKPVEQVYIRARSRFPEIKGWMDKYEILGGDDLIEKIHRGIDDADKFLIFLSPNSIDKQWVRIELRKALADEITGIKPEFIIPVKLGHIPHFPPFLEGRFYIDIEAKTEEEWLQDIHSAITRKKRSLDQPTENIVISVHIANDNPNAAVILFEAQFWAEPIGFVITTSKDIKSTMWAMPTLKGMQQVSISKLQKDRRYGIRIFDKTIIPKSPFLMGIEFESTKDPRDHIKSVERWDGANGEQSLSFVHFK